MIIICIQFSPIFYSKNPNPNLTRPNMPQYPSTEIILISTFQPQDSAKDFNICVTFFFIHSTFCPFEVGK